jgi:hypothetical protein
MNKGLLLTITEPAPRDEEEFNAWYDTEHLAERLAIPGFLSARRRVDAVPAAGAGKYLANETEWSRRMDAPTSDVEWILRGYRAYGRG